MFENRLLYCSALTKKCGAHNKIGNLLRLHKSALTVYTLLQTSAGNSELLPSDVIDFSMLPAQRFWRETVSFVRCHVTSK